MKQSSFNLVGISMGLCLGALFGSFGAYIYDVNKSNEVQASIQIEEVSELIKIENAIKELRPQLDAIVLEEILTYADKYSKEYNLPITLVLSIIDRESKFNPLAVSSKGARGLMQIMTKVHTDKLKEMGIDTYKAMHIGNNIKLGCWILREYYDQTKEMKKALKRYVGGVHDSYYVDVLTWYVTLNTMIMEKPNVREETKREETAKIEQPGVQ